MDLVESLRQAGESIAKGEGYSRAYPHNQY